MKGINIKSTSSKTLDNESGLNSRKTKEGSNFLKNKKDKKATSNSCKNVLFWRNGYWI